MWDSACHHDIISTGFQRYSATEHSSSVLLWAGEEGRWQDCDDIPPRRTPRPTKTFSDMMVAPSHVWNRSILVFSKAVGQLLQRQYSERSFTKALGRELLRLCTWWVFMHVCRSASRVIIHYTVIQRAECISVRLWIRGQFSWSMYVALTFRNVWNAYRNVEACGLPTCGFLVGCLTSICHECDARFSTLKINGWVCDAFRS